MNDQLHLIAKSDLGQCDPATVCFCGTRLFLARLRPRSGGDRASGRRSPDEISRRASTARRARYTVPPREDSSSASSWPPAIRSCNSSGSISPFTAVPRVRPRFSTVKRSPTAIA